ncbi:MAG: hypothetical protein FWC94_05455 [Bacteroidales bacterium]|nr:hypothetical protein [Bacteroidales bacterium]
MTTISSREFLLNPAHYFNLAKRENLAVKRGSVVFQITVKPQKACAWTALSERFGWTVEELKSISPSKDPYWDNPRNVEELLQRDKDRKEGKNPIVATLRTSEDIKSYLGLTDEDLD